MRFCSAVPAIVGVMLILGIGFLVLGRPAGGAGWQAPAGHGGHAAMAETAMKRWAKAWWATHPRVGAPSLQPAAATFTARNFRFDADNDATTQIDTVTIAVGESVTWQWVDGIHTITNGTGFEDPDAGTLFDQPSDLGNQQFTFVFDAAGAVPFFCRPHETFSMKGVVIVGGTTGVEPLPGGVHGFTAAPSPSPTRAGVSFGFALQGPGRVRADVFDATGRRVATVLDRDFDAGAHVGAWDGRTAGGAAADAGLYFLRLRLPGYQGSRAVVITR